MSSNSLAFILFISASVLTQAESQITDCTTPSGGQGNCISITECEILANLIRNFPTSSNLELVQKSRCDFLPGSLYPRVCCPNSGTTTTKPLPVPDPQPLPGDEHPNLHLLPTEDCGLSSTERIIGGNVTALDEFPWTALLEYQKKDGTKMFGCGGVLISNRYVMTAAHCTTRYLRKLNLRLVNIRLGEHNTETDPDCNADYCADPPVNYGIEKEIPHPNYTTNKHHYNDIALIRLNTDVASTDYVKPICIPNDEEALSKNYDGRNLTVTGWGKTGDSFGRNSPVKLKVTLPVVANEDCARDYNLQGKIRVTANQICAGGRRDMDACGGDSGGPLMDAIYLSSDYQVHFHIIGVVSFGAECKIVETPSNQKWIPGVYTRVSSYREWILDQLEP